MSEESLDHFKSIMKKIEESGAFDLKKGQCRDMICPECGGHGHADCANLNGHLRIWCDNCDFLMMS